MRDTKPHALLAAAAVLLAACGQSSTATAGSPVDSRAIDAASLQGRITFSDETHVYVMNANGSGFETLTSGATHDVDPAWSPDGRQIVFRSERDGSSQIYVMNANGTGQRRISRTREDNWGPAWSPDGAWIAFNSARGTENTAMYGYVMRPDGSDLRKLGSIWVEYPAWSPDGKRIAFMSMEPGAHGTNPDYDIYVMNVDGSGVRRLTHAPGEDGWPAWSPDGKKIAFTSARDDRGQSGNVGPFFDIFLMDADGSHQVRLTQAFSQFSAWSPDGRYLVFASGGGLAVVRPDGSGLARLPIGVSGDVGFPDWIR